MACPAPGTMLSRPFGNRRVAASAHSWQDQFGWRSQTIGAIDICTNERLAPCRHGRPNSPTYSSNTGAARCAGTLDTCGTGYAIPPSDCRDGLARQCDHRSHWHRLGCVPLSC